MVGNARQGWILLCSMIVRFRRFASATRLSTEGSVPTDTPLFRAVLIGTTIVAGALTFLPALAHVGMVSALPMVAR
jgi:K+-transporting ATPase A subunit